MQILQWRLWLVPAMVAATASLTSAGGAEPAAEVAVAIRYLQQTGTSHSHLYLYREDGELLRQLTKDDGGQDHAPAFAPDGETIVFTRVSSGGSKQWWSVEPHGNHLRRLEAAPDWYVQTKDSPHFDSLLDDPDNKRLLAPEAGSSEKIGDPPVYRSSDGQSELVLKISPGEDDALTLPPHGKSYLLRDLKTGRETTLGKLPNFLGLFDLLSCTTSQGQERFLLEPSLRVAFFSVHLGSTDGNATFALALDEPRLIQLSPNDATPYPLAGEAGFLVAAEERYVPFGDGKHTANCSYLDHWDAKFSKVRYAREKAPAVFYGAAMYRPGKQPRVIAICDEDRND